MPKRCRPVLSGKFYYSEEHLLDKDLKETICMARSAELKMTLPQR